MYIITESQIEPDIINKYEKKYDIYIVDESKYVNLKKVNNFYYCIHRNCSCDFIINMQNTKEIRDFFLQLDDQFIFFLIEDDGQFGDDFISNIEKFIYEFPIVTVRKEELVYKFPYIEKHIRYQVTNKL